MAHYSNPEKFDKLTPKQNMIIYALQNGWCLIGSNDSHIVTCASPKAEFTFSSTLFWRIYRMGLIYQENGYPHDYHLTKAGRELKTKPVDLTPRP